MSDITIYKPASVTVRLVNGQYVIIKPPGMTIQAINVATPVEFCIDPPLRVGTRGSTRVTGNLGITKE